MHIETLSIQEFENFVNNNPLGNHYQSHNYALLMAENGYDYELIGYVDEYHNIHAASLILFKRLTKLFKYGYAPKGFIIDYFDKKLLKEFTEDIIDYYRKKKVVFIKINPEIAISEVNPKTGQKQYNGNVEIKDNLIDLGYVKLKDNIYFESMIPHYNAIVPLKDFNKNKLSKNTRNKIKRAEAKGLNIELADKSGIDILYDFIKRKRSKEANYYKEYYNVFSKSNNIDLFLVSINTNDFLINAKDAYEKELDINSEINSELIKHHTDKMINIKMNSDRKLLSYKNDVLEANNKINENFKIYIAGALVIKYKNRINIVMSGFDTKYKRFNPNYFLHYKILDYYKKHYDFADLNGMTGDFSKNNPYHGLNQFKLGFQPKLYEFIGEYDLVIKETIYHSLLKSGKLAKIFNKNDIKK